LKILKGTATGGVSRRSTAGRDYLRRSSMFSESGLKHRLGGPFLWFVSFGQSKEMNDQSKIKLYKKSDVLFCFSEVLEFGI
jgi:hypothetical protein